MRLYDRSRRRLYLNAAERRQFAEAARIARPDACSLAMTLLHTGCRLSEALELTSADMQREARVLTLRTLKRRNPHHFREVPIPPELVQLLGAVHENREPQERRFFWQHRDKPLCRTTAYRWIKAIMSSAGIRGAQASPKGLRHGYGIHAIRCGVPLNMLQKWMGHAALSTTAIYTNALGAEERSIAERMWRLERSRAEKTDAIS
ncbi:site-specific integrase [Salipiger sp. P9]|uniref:tyrosine-type recombinase/integrase n=1 Tax=Salipiger pentaromativorans TaxID=2943193 RepID=UPI0021588A2F|nr:site-specific integrase [Salipiger pentaromativorans]MCR8551163.1 site-specific integrase [Salipiger pentaromativorans]